MKSKQLVVFIATLAIIAMASVALAANVIVPSPTSSEPIQEGATCAKAGGFTLGFDGGTNVNAGDVVSFNLLNPVKLCNSFDFILAPNGNDTWWGVTDFPSFAVPASPAKGSGVSGISYYVTDDSSQAVYTNVWGSVNGTNTGLQFRVQGTSGQSTVTLTALGNRTSASAVPVHRLNVQNNGTLFVRFLDGGTTNVLVDALGFGIHNAPGSADDNTLCVNPTGFTGTLITSHFFSPQGKFSFNPSNPENAHIVSAAGATMSAVTTCTKTVGETECISLPTGGQNSNCHFDFDVNHASDIWCATTYSGNVLQLKDTAMFPASTNFRATVELKVEDATTVLTGDNGFYFVNTAGIDANDGEYEFSALSTCTQTYAITNNPVFNTRGTTAATAQHYLANDAVGSMKTSTATCSFTTTERVVKLVSEEFASPNANNLQYFYLNLPTIMVDTDSVPTGATKLVVSVTMQELPCYSNTFQFDVACIGCGSNTPIPTTFTLTYPYFTQAQDSTIGDTFLDGMVVANMTDNVMTWTAMFYEADGDSFSYTPADTVPARQMAIAILNSLLPDFVLVATGPNSTGTIGDMQSYAVVTTDQQADGIALVFDLDTGVAMGYLPRL